MKNVTVFILSVFLVLPLLVYAAEKEERNDGMTIVFDSQNTSPLFVNFFNDFSGRLLEWWQQGGRVAVLAEKWTVHLQEEYSRREGFSAIVISISGDTNKKGPIHIHVILDKGGLDNAVRNAFNKIINILTGRNGIEI